MTLQTIFSPDRRYRYTLARQFQGELLLDGCNKMKDGYVMWIGLNPSTADENKDDPTVRRCIAFTKAWGYGAMIMTNLFAFRATDPRVMKQATYPIGYDNDHWLREMAGGAALVVAAWGNHGKFMERGVGIIELLQPYCILMCLRVTGAGHPEHPLYLPGSLKPVPFGRQK